jgi:hypothetical protein
MLATGRLYDGLKLPIQDAYTSFSAVSQPSSRHDEVDTVHDHDPTIPKRKMPPTRSIIVFVSVIFSIIFIFPHSLFTWPPFALPCLFNGFLFNPLKNATGGGTTFPNPTSPAFSSNGRTDQVQWDNYTLVLRGQRVLI